MSPPRRLRCRAAGSRLRGERGSVALELTLLTPLLLLLMLFAVGAGRLADARLHVGDAAAQAARAASTAATPAGARQLATATATAALGGPDAACTPMTVATDTTQLTPGGEVTVTVTCTVTLSDLGLLALPGSTDVQSRFTAPVDRFRSTVANGTATP